MTTVANWELDELVRELIRRAAACRREPVLLDRSMSGVRCLLLRSDETAWAPLSPRERQIALRVARGESNKIIAAALHLSAWTVAGYLRRIYGKLGVGSRVEMVECLHERGALPASPTEP